METSFLSIIEGNWKYGKGENKNESCGFETELVYQCELRVSDIWIGKAINIEYCVYVRVLPTNTNSVHDLLSVTPQSPKPT